MDLTISIPDETVTHYNAAYGYVVSDVPDDPDNPRPTPAEFFVNNVLSQIEAIAKRRAEDELAATRSAELTQALQATSPERAAYQKRLADAAAARAEREKPEVEPAEPAPAEPAPAQPAPRQPNR